MTDCPVQRIMKASPRTQQKAVSRNEKMIHLHLKAGPTYFSCILCLLYWFLTEYKFHAMMDNVKSELLGETKSGFAIRTTICTIFTHLS